MFYLFVRDFLRDPWCHRLLVISAILDTMRHLFCWRTLVCTLIAVFFAYSLCYPIVLEKKRQAEKEVIRISEQFRPQ